MKKPIIYTIGHSTHPIGEFVELLRTCNIQMVVDVRTIPRSRYNPQFNEQDLKQSLKQNKIQYKHIKNLGGLRGTTKDSINCGWHNRSFRGFADYMGTSEFENGLEELINVAKVKTTTIMCAEAVPWRCHRSLIGDALIKKGWLVRDIMSRTSVKRHLLTKFLKMKKGKIVYPEIKV